jgi:hypothetical protein
LYCSTLQALEKPSSEEIRHEMSKNSDSASIDGKGGEGRTAGTGAGAGSGTETTSETPPVKQNKGYLREALAASSALAAAGNGRTDVILDESDIQPTGLSSQLPPPVMTPSSPEQEGGAPEAITAARFT